MADYELTEDEAKKFLQNILDINISENLRNDPAKFLETILRKFQQKVPFQSFTLASVSPSERQRPLWPEMKEALFTGKGGVCYVMNIFMFVLLKSLGYDAYLSHSSVGSFVHTHLVIIVRNLRHEGDKNLVDVGFTSPVYGFLPLDFDDESPVFVTPLLEYKYKWLNGRIFRYHRKPEVVDIPDDSNTWHTILDIEEEMFTDVHEFDACFDNFYTNPELRRKSLLQNFPVASLFHPWRTMLKDKCYIENDDGELIKIDINSIRKDELLELVQELFNVIPKAEVTNAISHFISVKICIQNFVL